MPRSSMLYMGWQAWSGPALRQPSICSSEKLETPMYQILSRPLRVEQGSDRVGPGDRDVRIVDVVEIDVVRAEPLEAGVEGGGDVQRVRVARPPRRGLARHVHVRLGGARG